MPFKPIETLRFPSGSVQHVVGSAAPYLEAFSKTARIHLITDKTVFGYHGDLFQGYRHTVLPSGESGKAWASIDLIVQDLIRTAADRNSVLVGVGGGSVTDVTGFAASIYMRGIRCGFVPTTIMAMADAAIGGKNGINIGPYKNLIGAIHQPAFILQDRSLLQTLPEDAWRSGFAEIIKMACAFDQKLFDALERHTLADYRMNAALLEETLRACAIFKARIVQQDEQDLGLRKKLNFGHTVGHAIERLYDLPHGYAVAIGMMAACRVSQRAVGLSDQSFVRINRMLTQYGLPSKFNYDVDAVMNLLRMDKKSVEGEIDFICLAAIGNSMAVRLPMADIRLVLQQCSDEQAS